MKDMEKYDFVAGFMPMKSVIGGMLEHMDIKTRIAYKIEGIRKNDKKIIRRWYYSFCTELKK
jgi:hypothetical protein